MVRDYTENKMEVWFPHRAAPFVIDESREPNKLQPILRCHDVRDISKVAILTLQFARADGRHFFFRWPGKNIGIDSSRHFSH